MQWEAEMKTIKHSSIVTAVCGIFLLVTAAAFAQENQRVRLRIEEIDLETRVTPSYEAQGYSQAANQGYEWLIMAAEYEVRGGQRGWVDDLSFTWHALMLNGNVPRVLMNKTVNYQDVYEEDTHYAVAFIRPSVIRRYYDESGRISKRDIVIHLEVKYNNRTLVEQAYNPKQGIPKRWWTFSPPKVNIVEHGLMSRPETPFAPLNYDFYNFIKPEE